MDEEKKEVHVKNKKSRDIKIDSLKKAERKSKVFAQKSPVSKFGGTLSRHRKSQEEIISKGNNLKFKTDVEVSSRNLAKYGSGNLLKKSRTKELAQPLTLKSGKNLHSSNIKSQNCLGLTQKLKKK